MNGQNSLNGEHFIESQEEQVILYNGSQNPTATLLHGSQNPTGTIKVEDIHLNESSSIPNESEAGHKSDMNTQEKIQNGIIYFVNDDIINNDLNKLQLI